MEFGVHLPLMDFGDHPFSIDHLVRYSETAARLGFAALSVNDHHVRRPMAGWSHCSGRRAGSQWRDVAGHDRGPARRSRSGCSGQDARSDRSSEWRPPHRRCRAWLVGSRLRGRRDGLRGAMGPSRRSGPGSTRLVAPPWPPLHWQFLFDRRGQPRTVTDLGRWAANTPALFAEAWASLGNLLTKEGKDPLVFPNALVTMWCYITEDEAEAARILEERIAPAVHRPVDLLRDRLGIGPADRFAEQLNAFAAAGVQRVFIWPVADETYQLERFAAEVLPVIERDVDAK